MSVFKRSHIISNFQTLRKYNSEHLIVLFDGVCNFCNSTINFIIKNDTNKRLRFTTQQSTTGKNLISELTLHNKDESIIFIENGKISTQASAIFNICKYLNWPFKIFYLLAFIPGFISNPIYRFIARNRYKWFGKKEQCMIPTTDIKERFIG